MNILDIAVDIRDSAAFEAIDIEKIMAYAKEKGWELRREDEDFWVLAKFPKYIYIPKLRSCSDYASSMKHAFCELAIHEKIPQLRLLAQLWELNHEKPS